MQAIHKDFHVRLLALGLFDRGPCFFHLFCGVVGFHTLADRVEGALDARVVAVEAVDADQLAVFLSGEGGDLTRRNGIDTRLLGDGEPVPEVAGIEAPGLAFGDVLVGHPRGRFFDLGLLGISHALNGGFELAGRTCEACGADDEVADIAILGRLSSHLGHADEQLPQMGHHARVLALLSGSGVACSWNQGA